MNRETLCSIVKDENKWKKKSSQQTIPFIFFKNKKNQSYRMYLTISPFCNSFGRIIRTIKQKEVNILSERGGGAIHVVSHSR